LSIVDTALFELLPQDLAAARACLERGLADFNLADRQFYSAITVQDGRVLVLAAARQSR
jgi:hypothetical protein